MLKQRQDFEPPEKRPCWPCWLRAAERTNISQRNETFLKGLSEGESCDQ